MASVTEIFSTDPEFCGVCGAILPVRTGKVSEDKCFVCKSAAPKVKEDEDEPGIIEKATYVIHFNPPDVYSRMKILTEESSKKKKSGADGPIVKRDCKECGHNKMSYMTLQLRSADEGQTIFFTCVQCKFKESENS